MYKRRERLNALCYYAIHTQYVFRSKIFLMYYCTTMAAVAIVYRLFYGNEQWCCCCCCYRRRCRYFVTLRMFWSIRWWINHAIRYTIEMPITIQWIGNRSFHFQHAQFRYPLLIWINFECNDPIKNMNMFACFPLILQEYSFMHTHCLCKCVTIFVT